MIVKSEWTFDKREDHNNTAWFNLPLFALCFEALGDIEAGV